MKTLTNKQWLTIILFPKHRPFIRDTGDQRDPQEIIVCSCNPYAKRGETGFNPNDTTWYQSHLLNMIEADFPNLFAEDTQQAYDGK